MLEDGVGWTVGGGGSGVRCSDMEGDGAEWNGVDWGRAGRKGVEWSQVEWSRMKWGGEAC